MSPSPRGWIARWGLALLAGLVVAGGWAWILHDRHSRASIRELPRNELELRDGILYAANETAAFSGRIFEDYRPGRRKLEIGIQNGRADGLTRGWYENGQMEVEETFRNGVSNGPRTRWHANGTRKSLAQIVSGEVVGEFLEWHENAQLATRMTVRGGKPSGLAEAWYPGGALRSRTEFKNGEMIGRKEFPDAANAPNPAPGDQ